MSQLNDADVRRLLLAVFDQAVRDAGASGNSANATRRAAREWLLEYGGAWAAGLGLRISTGDIESWVSAGCPIDRPRSQIKKENVMDDGLNLVVEKVVGLAIARGLDLSQPAVRKQFVDLVSQRLGSYSEGSRESLMDLATRAVDELAPEDITAINDPQALLSKALKKSRAQEPAPAIESADAYSTLKAGMDELAARSPQRRPAPASGADLSSTTNPGDLLRQAFARPEQQEE